MKIGKVLFIVNDQGSWIDRDRDFISKEFDVTDLRLKPANYSFLSWAIVLQILRTDVLFFWFGSLQFLPLALLGRVLGKKIIIVAGGFDVARGSDIGHGAYCESKTRQILRTFLFKLAHKVLAVSKSNMQEAVSNAGVPEKKLELVYLGFDRPEEELTPWDQRPQKVVMLAAAKKDTFVLKGIEHLVEIARMTPSYEFILMGNYDEELSNLLSANPVENFTAKGFVPYGSESFIRELQTSRFVLQLSRYESFGAAVVDAGLFGCFPLVFDRFALVEVVEKIGKCFPFGDRKAISDFLQREGREMQVDAKSIQNAFYAKFPNQDRRRRIVDVIESLL